MEEKEKEISLFVLIRFGFLLKLSKHREKSEQITKERNFWVSLRCLGRSLEKNIQGQSPFGLISIVTFLFEMVFMSEILLADEDKLEEREWETER